MEILINLYISAQSELGVRDDQLGFPGIMKFT